MRLYKLFAWLDNYIGVLQVLFRWKDSKLKLLIFNRDFKVKKSDTGGLVIVAREEKSTQLITGVKEVVNILE